MVGWRPISQDPQPPEAPNFDLERTIRGTRRRTCVIFGKERHLTFPKEEDLWDLGSINQVLLGTSICGDLIADSKTDPFLFAITVSSERSQSLLGNMPSSWDKSTWNL